MVASPIFTLFCPSPSPGLSLQPQVLLQSQSHGKAKSEQSAAVCQVAHLGLPVIQSLVREQKIHAQPHPQQKPCPVLWESQPFIKAGSWAL